MSDTKRLDESLSAATWKKSLTGNPGVEVDWGKVVISNSGELQPASSGSSQVPPTGGGSGKQ